MKILRIQYVNPLLGGCYIFLFYNVKKIDEIVSFKPNHKYFVDD